MSGLYCKSPSKNRQNHEKNIQKKIYFRPTDPNFFTIWNRNRRYFFYALAYDPHRKLGLRTRQNQRRDVPYACSVHMYQCINEFWLYNSSNFALHYNYYTKFLSKHCIKRVLDTEMNGYHCFNFTEKLSYKVVDPKQPKNVKFSLWSIIETFPRGEARIIRGGAKWSLGRCKAISR
jgi:hypothetical protein